MAASVGARCVILGVFYTKSEKSTVHARCQNVTHLCPVPRIFFHFSVIVICKVNHELLWGLDIKERSFVNHWVIRRMLVCPIVSGMCLKRKHPEDFSQQKWYDGIKKRRLEEGSATLDPSNFSRRNKHWAGSPTCEEFLQRYDLNTVILITSP